VGLPFLKCPALTWPLVTLHLGVGFITFEVRESIYYVHEGAMMQTSAFFSSFFVLVGIHGVHVFCFQQSKWLQTFF
jgi:heme/copper-type cytochrome/quinol oxidase subunit 3